MQLVAITQKSAAARVQVLRQPEGARGLEGAQQEPAPLKIKGRSYVSTEETQGMELHWEVKMLSPPWQPLKDFLNGDFFLEPF